MNFTQVSILPDNAGIVPCGFMPLRACLKEKPMNIKIVLSFLLLTYAPVATADSFCRYDEGLIGTKAIGYAALFYLEKEDYRPEDEICTLRAYASADAADSDVMSCVVFERMPTPYVEDGLRAPFSDYFALLAYAQQDGMIEARLKNGGRRWLAIRPELNIAPALPYPRQPGPAPQILHGQPSATAWYSAPDLASEVAAPAIDKEAQRAFFAHPFFAALMRLGAFDPENIDAYAHDGDNYSFGVVYDTTEIVADGGGRLWLKAEERLEQKPYLYFDYDPDSRQRLKTLPEAEQAAIKDAVSGETFQSAITRTVYFPHRSPDGTIETVMVQGPYCD